MGKKVSGTKRGAGSGEGSTEAWTSTDHAIRKAKQQRKYGAKHEERERRSALLTRDSKQKREQGKIRLHIKRVQRIIEKLRERLETWDEQEEQRLEKERKERERKEREEAMNPTKKIKIRNDPTKWKLKGAARPASEVYDFDTRYVDPHIKAHEEAKKKAKRTKNIFSLYKGRFGEESKGIPQPHCRDFLSFLMQLGNLSLQASQLKSARQAFLECLELDSNENPITPARCSLMKLYIEANRPESARRLWEKLSPDDASVWIRYSAALIEFVSWKILEEPGSTEETAMALLKKAIQTNIFCAYQLAYWEAFQDAMDYTDEIEDATEEEPLEEAIEYCNSDQGMGSWHGTEGALEWLKETLQVALKGKIDGLTTDDLQWRPKLADIKREYEAQAAAAMPEVDEEEEENSHRDTDSESDEEEEPTIDGAMFAGMFETAMEMLEQAGSIDELK